MRKMLKLNKVNKNSVKRARILAVIDKAQGNSTEISRLTGIPQPTVWRIINNDEEFIKLRQIQKKELIQIANKKAKEILLKDIEPHKAKSLVEATTAFGTLVDKMAVLSGENTKWGQQVNIGEKQFNIVVSPKARSLLKR